MVSKNSYRFMAVFWAGLIFLVLSLPGMPAQQTPYLSYFGHFVLFFVFGYFLGRSTGTWQAFKGLPEGVDVHGVYAGPLGIGIPYAIFTEIWQAFLPFRSFGLYDIFWDILGLVFVYFFGKNIFIRKR